MAAFDPELYLRLLGERALAAGEDLQHHHRNQSVMPEAAAALSVNGVITPELAEEITSEYSLASMIIQESPMLQHRRQWGPDTSAGAVDPEPLEPQRAYALDSELQITGGRLQLGVLTTTANGGRLHAVFISDTDLHSTGGGPPVLSIRLPSGQSAQTHFGGGWGEHRASGHFNFEADVSANIAWLEIDGHRLELSAPAPPSPVTVEPLDPGRRAMRYLWQLLADFNGHHNHSGLANRAASDALIRAGLIAPDDPELEAVFWVADTRNAHGPQRMRRRMRRGRGPSTPARAPAAVPAPWRCVLQSPVSGPGPEGTLALAAATPVFDGLSVVVNALRSHVDSATLEVTATHTLFGSSSGPVAWWAEDDRGNHYLGETGSWGGGAEGATTGEIEFGPLHPKARTLTVAVTSLNARALIPIALDWPARTRDS